jgi:predicted MFS family arabinose efflux permease
MTWLALPWFALRTTGSPQRMTWVLIAELVPIAVLGFWGGAIAARLGTRRTMLVCDIVRAPLLAAIPILHSLDLLAFPVLLALVAATGIFIAPYFAVQRAVVPELVGEEQLDVAEATAFFQAANRLTIFLGPPLAGVLIGVIGTANVLYVDAASYVLSFALVAAFVHPPEVEVPEDNRGVLAGVRFLFSDRLLRVWTPAMTLLDTAWTLIFASLPVLVVSAYDANPRILGWLFGALGGGALVGAFVALRLVRRVEPLTMTAAMFLCQMTSMWLLAVPAPWVVAVSGMAGAGFFMSLVNSPMQALKMLRIPRQLRPQALAANGVMQSLASPAGLVIAGWALARFETRAVLSVVLAAQTIAVLTIVAAALAERSTLRADAAASEA